MAAIKGTKQYHDFITEIEKLPAYTNCHQDCELTLDDNDEALGLHQIFEINIKGDGNENITVGMDEEDDQSEASLTDDESVSDDIPNENINQEIINYVYDNLLAKEVNNESSSNNLDPNDKVVKNLRATSKNKQLDDNDKNKPSSSTTVEKTHEEKHTIIKKDEHKLSLQAPVLVEGKCFISNDSIYFISAFNQILKNSSIVRIKYESLLSIKKAQELNIIPEWFKIKPDEDQSFSFTALLDKDDAYGSISSMIEYAIDSKKKLETNTVTHDETKAANQKNNLDSNRIESSLEFTEKVLITKDVDEMISMKLDSKEIELLEENDFFHDIHHAIGLYVNKDFKEVYYSIFSKIHPRNPFYDFYQRVDQQGADYSKFDDLPDPIQVPSGYSINLKYNVSLEKAKKSLYGSFVIPSRADINETVKLFFFRHCIILQTQVNFITKFPILGAFRAVITAIIHDVPSEDGSGKNATQIDMLYGVYFFKSAFFKDMTKRAVLPLLRLICLRFKICIAECLRDIHKDKAFRERGIEITDINAIFRKYYNINDPSSSAPSSSSFRRNDYSSCITNNNKSKDSNGKKTLTGFKNQIINPQNNKTIIKAKHFENILNNYLSEAMKMNPKVTPSEKIPNFTSKSIAILMYIYMGYIQSRRSLS
ncbi:conserved Plasmodium protein, unknown function [Plasmodium chabaudi chabaudi]|uniref:GRAM domain-containing protein n=1 Tax=Plasmodium chabaudi chabaudi TaxID=31271 RepID=A0A1D3LDU3_PLACU|nr:conserved Plasmodium protein, unknown function [Plasmodium chabaudi chabaudi]